MILTKTRAIVLHITRFGDDQLIVDTLTEAQGRVSFICRISHSPKAKIRPQLFQPLMLLRVEYDYRQRQRLQKLKTVGIEQPLVSIPFDPKKLAVSLFLSEFLSYVTRQEQRDTPLFTFLHASILWLDTTTRPIGNFHLVLMMRLTPFVGFFPNMESYREGRWFDLREGTFVTYVPSHPDFLNPTESRQLVMLMRLRYETMHLCAMSRTERNHCTEVIIKYYRLHLPEFPELKSLEVLRQLW